jgi:adenylyltransferase/sulfurtransferase
MADPAAWLADIEASTEVFVVCRLGNDSQIAADALRRANPGISIKDVIGGLKSWAEHIDNNFPVY